MNALELPLPEAHEPPEVRGSGRDDVALLVATRHDLGLAHARFHDLPCFLNAGDLLVVNTSATLAAALDARLGGEAVQLWLSTPLHGGAWVVELRTHDRQPHPRPPIGARLDLPNGAHAELVDRFAGSGRLVVARLDLGEPLEEYLRQHGQPIRYGYVPEEWPVDAYQTVFGREPGSAEMPSAGRPFTAQLVLELLGRGVLFAPVVLHTGVSSPERGEPPYPERFRVPEATARLVGDGLERAHHRRADDDRTVAAGQGWTTLVVTPERGLGVVDGLLTGWHERDSSHLQLLEAVAGAELLDRSYRAALERRYLWHEFGDIHLILP